MKNSSQRIAEALRATAAMIATVDDRPSRGWGSRTITLADVAGIFHAFADQIDAAERPDLRDRSTTGSSASAKEAASVDDIEPSHASADTPDASAAQQAAEVDTSSPASEPVVVQLGRHAFEALGGPFYASAAPPTGAGSHYLSAYRFLDDGRLYSFFWKDTIGPTRLHLRRVNDPGSLAAIPVAAWRHATPVGSHLCFSFDVFHHFDTPDRPSFVIGRDRYDAIVATIEKFAAHITKGPR